jgi:hypothetical protein
VLCVHLPGVSRQSENPCVVFARRCIKPYLDGHRFMGSQSLSTPDAAPCFATEVWHGRLITKQEEHTLTAFEPRRCERLCAVDAFVRALL